MNKHTRHALLVLIPWAIIAIYSLTTIKNRVYGVMIALDATLALFLVAYCSWTIYRVEQRLKKYIEAMNRASQREHERQVKK